MKRVLTLWTLMGAIYLLIEGVWRGGGYIHFSMALVGGLAGVLVGAMNQQPAFYRSPIWVQSALGAVVVLVVEFLAGCIINIWLGLGVWDYSHLPLNILGQVCVPFAFLWIILMPFVIWLEDTIRYKLWNEGSEYTLASIYIDFITLR